MQEVMRNPYVGRGINGKINYVLELLNVKQVPMTVHEINQYIKFGVKCYLIMESARMQGLVNIVGQKVTPALDCQAKVKRNVYELTADGQQRLKYKSVRPR